MSSIQYFIEPIFKVEFFKIKCVDFKKKKNKIEKVLEQYPEIPFENFLSNRNKCNILIDLKNIFRDEFILIEKKFNKQIELQRAWSVTYDKGHYHIPHNHSSRGYAGILYLRIKKDSPLTTYIQPFNNDKDETVLYQPKVEEGDIMIVPQFILHYTEPNKTYIKKRILSFDFL